MHRVLFILLLIRSISCETLFDKALQYVGCLSRCYDLSCDAICNETQFLPQSSATFNATLHCKDTDLLTLRHSAGVYIIQQSTFQNSKSEAKVIQGTMSLHSDLNPGERYRYRVHRITNEGVSYPEWTSWFQTTRMHVKPDEIKEIIVENIIPDNLDSTRLQAEVHFQPGKDLSCYYDVLSWSNDEILSIGDVNATKGFHFRLHHLQYSDNNTLVISARNKGSSKSSNNVSTIFKTPSCLDVHKNLTICGLSEVSGLRLENVDQSNVDCNITVSWNKPEYEPEYYAIQIVTLDDTEEPFTTTVPGSSTNFVYSLNKIGFHHVFSIIAESQGKNSRPVSILNNIEKRKDKSTLLPEVFIFFSSVGMIIVILFSSCFLYRYKKTKKKNQHECHLENYKEKIKLAMENDNEKTTELENKLEDDFLIPKDRFEIIPMQLRMKEILGSGISGIVRLGSLQLNQEDSTDVAVKMLKDCPTEEDIRNFHQEISIMKSAGIHRNIVSMIGCCTISTSPMLIVEYCSRGDLQTFLRKIWENLLEDALERKTHCSYMNSSDERKLLIPDSNTNEDEKKVAISNQLYDIQQGMLNNGAENITVTDLLSFAFQVANGMEFLSMNRIVHRDLAARNVLICADKTAKISDFGLSRDIYQENIYKKQGNGKLPIKWMAIEALTHQIYTSQSDVWSFGILLWEIVTLGCSPYPDIPINMVLQRLQDGYRMRRPHNCGVELYDIMKACWQTRPRSRPTFTNLKKDLDKLLETVSQNEYLNLYNVEPGTVDPTEPN